MALANQCATFFAAWQRQIQSRFQEQDGGKVETFEETEIVVRGLDWIFRHKGIEIVDFKDRMNSPNPGGWGDVLLLFKVVGSTGHICEMQIALHMLLSARKEMGAHAAYAQARHFIEIFETTSDQQFNPSEIFTL